MLAGRVLEGMSFVMMMSATPVILSLWFPPEKRGLPMALYSMCVPVGILLIFNLANLIIPDLGWRGVWWFNLILFVVTGFLFLLFVKYPEGYSFKSDCGAAKADGDKDAVTAGFKSLTIWLLCFICLIAGMCNSAFSTYYPTYLVQSLGLEMSAANSYSSLATIGMLSGGLLIGVVLNRVSNRKHSMLLIISMVVVSVAVFMLYRITSVAILPVYMIILGIALQITNPIAFNIVPEAVSSPLLIGIAMSIVSFGSASGGVVAPMIIGPIVESSGGNWRVLAWPLLIFGVVGLILAVTAGGLLSTKYKKAELAKSDI